MITLLYINQPVFHGSCHWQFLFHVAAVDANNRLPPCNGDIAKAILRIQLPYGETSHGTSALHSFLRSTEAAVRNVFAKTSRWVPTTYRCSYRTYQWPYEYRFSWGVIKLHKWREIDLLITAMGPTLLGSNHSDHSLIFVGQRQIVVVLGSENPPILSEKCRRGNYLEDHPIW